MSTTHMSSKGKIVHDVPEGRTAFGAKLRALMLEGRAKNQGEAILLAARLDPDLYNEWQNAGRPTD